MSERFADLPNDVRFRKLETLRLNADWASVNGPLGGIILHLRHRARRARRGARIFLGVLLVTVVSGLAFYLGLPLVQGYVDGRRDTLESSLRTIETQNRQLDRDRESLVNGKEQTPGLAALLKHMPETVLEGTGEPIEGSVELGDALILYSRNGTILRSTNAGLSFDTVVQGTGEPIEGSVELGGALILYGFNGTILRSTNAGLSFDTVVQGTGEPIEGSVELGDALILYSRNGTILRSTNAGLSFDTVVQGTGEPIEGSVELGDALILYSRNGTILRSTNAGLSFDTVVQATGEAIWGSVELGDALILYGEDGMILRSANAGLSFDTVVQATGETLVGSVKLGDALILYGFNGTILRSTNAGLSFDTVVQATDDWIMGSVKLGDALILYVFYGTILRSTDAGLSFDTVVQGTGEPIRGSVELGDVMILYGEGGTVLRTTNRWRDAAIELVSTFKAGLDGDTQPSEFLDKTLPEDIRKSPALEPAREAFTALQTKRETLRILHEQTSAEIARYDASPLAYLREQNALAFERYLALCRGPAEPPGKDLTTACLTAWQTQQSGGETWWKALVDQVPPGILLLFLLATSGGLYRYNVRLAGFHDSRADALQLLSQGRTATQLRDILAKTPGEAVNLASIFLAADKVEMGTIKAKLGQAEIELAKALNAGE